MRSIYECITKVTNNEQRGGDFFLQYESTLVTFVCAWIGARHADLCHNDPYHLSA